MKMNKSIYIGAMSGTSHDAIDVSFISDDKAISLEFFYSYKLPATLKAKISNLIFSNNTSLSDLGQLNKEIGLAFFRAIALAITKSKISKSKIKGIAISGQTVRHEMKGINSFSMQLGDPNIIATKTNIPVAYDFRNTHISLGGEGAPIVPEFHAQIFYKKNHPRVVLNIGGIANYTYLNNKSQPWGSDTGPGNALMDVYCSSRLGVSYDKNGSKASKGTVVRKELNKLLNNKFFSIPFPKSTGKELFNIDILSKDLLKNSHEDILATLSEFTALSIVNAITKNKHSDAEIIVCGGGSKNTNLMNRIRSHHKNDLMLSEEIGFESQAIESMAFAWLGYKRFNKKKSLIQTSAKKYTKGVLGSVVRP
jgi:anhydro-N-acetylmuramic acid kinase